MAGAKANGVEFEGEIHFSLQGKGGVGKSLAASLLAQYFRHRRSIPVRCIDTDPVNQTFSQYRELGRIGWS